MTVKELKERLENIDNDKIVVISNGESWCNVEEIILKGGEVLIMEETEPVFSD
tara:strand:+ start:372 stop:530 length:159 start_codon:yes stop_codon:yes gene_type:complete